MDSAYMDPAYMDPACMKIKLVSVYLCYSANK